MNIFRSAILLALISSVDVSFSFLAHPRHHHAGGNVNAANVGGGMPSTLSRRMGGPAGSESRLFYQGGDQDENNLRRLIYDGRGDVAGSLLRRVGSEGAVPSEKGGTGEYGALSVSELKRLLDDRGVDYRDCLEKRDLVERLINTRGLAPPSSSFSSSSLGNDGLSHEENRVVNTFTRASPAVAYIQTISQQQIVQRGLSLKGTEVPMGAGSGFLWDDRVSSVEYVSLTRMMSTFAHKYSSNLLPPATPKKGSHSNELSRHRVSHEDEGSRHQGEVTGHATPNRHDRRIRAGEGPRGIAHIDEGSTEADHRRILERPPGWTERIGDRQSVRTGLYPHHRRRVGVGQGRGWRRG
jgi:hypothetical protein